MDSSLMQIGTEFSCADSTIGKQPLSLLSWSLKGSGRTGGHKLYGDIIPLWEGLPRETQCSARFGSTHTNIGKKCSTAFL